MGLSPPGPLHVQDAFLRLGLVGLGKYWLIQEQLSLICDNERENRLLLQSRARSLR